jgi:hypothetical protein
MRQSLFHLIRVQGLIKLSKKLLSIHIYIISFGSYFKISVAFCAMGYAKRGGLWYSHVKKFYGYFNSLNIQMRQSHFHLIWVQGLIKLSKKAAVCTYLQNSLEVIVQDIGTLFANRYACFRDPWVFQVTGVWDLYCIFYILPSWCQWRLDSNPQTQG